MDALLATYASSDGEEDEEEAMPCPPPKPPSLFQSLPPPRETSSSSSSSTLVPLSLSLPLPLLLPLRSLSGTGKIQNSTSAMDKNSTLIAPPTLVGISAAERNRNENLAMAKSSPSIGSMERLAMASSSSSSSSSSIFSFLPPPKAEFGLGLVAASSGPPLKKQKRKMVEFRLPINKALLEAPEEGEEEERNQKASRTAVPPSGNSSGLSGLAAILPPPKNTLGAGSALGSGMSSQGGRRSILETKPLETSPQTTADQDNPTHTNINTGGVMNTHPTHANINTGGILNTVGIINTEVEVAAPSSSHDNGCDWSHYSEFGAPQSHLQQPVEYYSHEPHPSPQDYVAYDDSINSDSKLPIMADPLHDILRHEKRRGGKPGESPQFIEVKQADLTKSKVREDQLRVTGIAFGPSYQPASAAKGKPTKLHRRKHQIGSLYFDMKQKEIELVERRAKGHLTKSQTQAKYGW